MINASKKRPLEKVSLYGYKSLRKLELTLDPKLNILIGANGSGKTNFIRFFELLGNLMNSSLQTYISKNGRAEAFLFQGSKVTPEFNAALEFGLNQYRFTLQAASDNSFFFAKETAPFDGPIHGPIVNDQGAGHFESQLLKKATPTKAEKWVIETIRDWRVYHFHDTSSSAAVMRQCNLVDKDRLHSNAANIAAFLVSLSKSSPECFAQIEETIQQVAPFFGSFYLKEVATGEVQLLWKDRYSEVIYYPHQLSDGTLRYICLATLLLQPNPPSTIVIDEPELGLHPQAIKLLASLLHEASTRAQLIVATQSSILLDEFQPEQVIVADHINGETNLNRLDPARFTEWLQEYTLGQLWEKNELGGQP